MNTFPVSNTQTDHQLSLTLFGIDRLYSPVETDDNLEHGDVPVGYPPPRLAKPGKLHGGDKSFLHLRVSKFDII